MAIKLGEVICDMTADVDKSEELKVLLRIGWGAETTGKMAFRPADSLKKGDRVKITIEKLS